jgi:hypothetical protein
MGSGGLSPACLANLRSKHANSLAPPKALTRWIISAKSAPCSYLSMAQISVLLSGADIWSVSATTFRLKTTLSRGKLTLNSKTQHNSTKTDQLTEQRLLEISATAISRSAGVSFKMYLARTLVSSAITFWTGGNFDQPQLTNLVAQLKAAALDNLHACATGLTLQQPSVFCEILVSATVPHRQFQ